MAAKFALTIFSNDFNWYEMNLDENITLNK